MPITISEPRAGFLLAVSVIFAAIATGFWIANAVARRARRTTRERARHLAQLVASFLETRGTAAELRRAIRDTEASVFWTVLETQVVELSRRRRLELSLALERNRHSAEERRALRYDSPWRGELAARRLGLLTSARSRRALRVALRRGPEAVSLAAAWSLARDRDALGMRWILDHPETLAKRTHASRTALLRAFGRGALPELAQRLERPELSPSLERAVIEALGSAGYGAAGPVIERRLTAIDPELRVAAARALGGLPDARFTASLIQALEDPAWQVRAQAARSLGRTGAIAAVVPLSQRLTDRSWWVRRHAAYALESLGEAGRQALGLIIESSPDPYAREIAREALGGGIGYLSA